MKTYKTTQAGRVPIVQMLSPLQQWPSGIGRAFYCFMVGKRVTVLHAFIKKTQQTSDHELKLARKRLKELQNG